MCWALICHESPFHERRCRICLGPQHLCPEPLAAPGVVPHQAEQAAAREVCVPSLPSPLHAVACCSPDHALPVCLASGVAEGLTVSLCPRPSVRVETQPAFNLEHYRDSRSGPLQYIFWRQMLQSICPGEQIGARDGCAGWWWGRGCSAEAICN